MGGTGAGTVAQGAHIGIGAVRLAFGDQLRRHRLGQSVDLAQAKAQRDMLVEPSAVARTRPAFAGPFQRAVPLRQVHVRREHTHAVFRRIAHDLGRRVKAHGLRIEQRAGEGGGEVAFEPARHIDEMRKTGRMAFGKAVFAETADLVEAALRELAVVAARHHALDHHVLKLVHHPAAAESGHGLAQPVRLFRGEFCRVEGDLHRLFLEDRDAQRALENARQFVRRAMLRTWRRDDHGFGSASALQIGVDHVALDRPGTHDGDLDDEIVELARAQARKHVHLRPAFDLEDAERVPCAQHGIGFRVLARDIGQRQRAAVMIVEQVEAFPDAGQHAQRQHIDLEDAQRLDIVLVPFDETAIGHGAIADRHRLGQCAFGQDEPADMLRQMARYSNHLLGQFKNPLQVRIGHVHAGFLGVLLADLAAPPAPHRLGERGGDVFGQPHRLAHFSDRHARAVMDDRGA